MADGALAGVRVLELSTAQPGRTAGMLLAQLGADVVRVLDGDPPAPDSPAGPATLCWDAGKRYTAGGDVRRLALAAEIVLDDAPAGASRPAGCDAEALRTAAPGLVHVALPPAGVAGRWRDLPADPLLVSALGGFATYHPADEPGTPVASVVPMLDAVHGALGAVYAVAGLLGARRTGHGRALECSGLHAAAACLTSLVVEGIDSEQVVTPDGRVNARPGFRTYRCADGRWLHLSALTVEFFLPALMVLDRPDVMVLPGVDGEYLNTLRPEVGAVVGAELERTFAERPRDEWLAALTEAGVPCAPVLPREEWMAGEIVATSAPPVERTHPGVGPVVLPGPPVDLPATPAVVGELPGAPVDAAAIWADTRPAAAPDGPPPSLPLTGLRVLDLSTFLAAPYACTLFAGLGATVVKIEPPRGDPYRAFAPSFAAVHYPKTLASLDVRAPEGRSALLGLAGQADVVVDNFRPAVAERLGLGDGALGSGGLVRASVSAFGRTGAFADLPGFDPVLQSRSGLATAQGGADEPVTTSAPTVDVGTSALTALGALAALVAREGTGRGQHVTVSLAGAATFLQAAELTGYRGRPEPARGGRDHRGPEPARRYHRTADGWLALAAATPGQRDAVADLLGLGTLTHEAVAGALGAQPTEHWLAAFERLGVPACPVTPRAGLLTDPYLTANDFSHVVRDPVHGRFRLVGAPFRAVSPAGPPDPAPWPEATEVLARAGRLHPGYEVFPSAAG